MKQQGIQSDSWSETEAMRLVQRLTVSEAVQDRRALLARAVQDQVIPRLVSARRGRTPAASITPLQVERLVTLSLHGTQQAVDDWLAASGAAFESVMLDLITQAARRLGVMWEEDTCSFSDVTLGTLRLCRAVHAIGAAVEHLPHPGAPRALLAQVPGEQHGLGVIMLAQFFKRAGWEVQHELPRSDAELVDQVARHGFDMAGLSLSSTDGMDQLARLIADIRQSSRNPAIVVMVGGPPFIAQPALADQVGADATAMDGAQAVRRAHDLLTRQVCAA